MAKLRINGDSSGYVDLEAPNAASSSTLDLDQIPQKNVANTFSAINKFTDSVAIGTSNSPTNNLDIRSTGQAIVRVDGVGLYYNGIKIRNNYSSVQSDWNIGAAGGTSGWGSANGTFIIRDDTTNSTGLEIEQGAGSNTAALHIDSSGRVTTPQQPAFESYLGSSWYLTNSTIVPFNTLSYSTGNHYDASNYKFTAPIDGKYLFYIHTYTSATVGNIRALHFKWNVNGNQHRDLTHGGYSADGGTAYHPPITGTIILNLSAGDYVQVYFSGGGYSGGNVYLAATQSYWGGYLLG